MVAEETHSEAHQLQHGIGNLRATTTDTSGTSGTQNYTNYRKRDQESVKEVCKNKERHEVLSNTA